MQRVWCILPPPETPLLATAISSGRKVVIALAMASSLLSDTLVSQSLIFLLLLGQAQKAVKPQTPSPHLQSVYTGATKLH